MSINHQVALNIWNYNYRGVIMAQSLIECLKKLPLQEANEELKFIFETDQISAEVYYNFIKILNGIKDA